MSYQYKWTAGHYFFNTYWPQDYPYWQVVSAPSIKGSTSIADASTASLSIADALTASATPSDSGTADVTVADE